ncbi:MAG: peptidase S8 [Cyanobacteria bacterium NC_groundwater_1444_Ag_S-0.65um_54_12]|nr:peptidase S8 [Cyanobacteria bacterium NC_groundwater_1444_Ag_S-0.65um_54_12]
MPKFFAGLAGLFILLSIISCSKQPPTTVKAFAPPDGKEESDLATELIVKYRAPDGIRAESVWIPENISRSRQPVQLAGMIALDSTSLDSSGDTILVKVPDGISAKQLADRYARAPDVEWAIPNSHFRLPKPDASALPAASQAAAHSPLLIRSATIPANDPMVGQQWYLDRIHIAEAWQNSTGAGILVAIVDSGIDRSHRDLADAIEQSVDFIDRKGDAQDQNGHGTHVAGIVGARKDNGIGIAGIAPACRILAIKALDREGQSTLFSVARGIKFAADYAHRNGRHVIINLSLGGRIPLDPLDWLIGWYANRRGALLVAAAGNDSGPIGTPARLKYFMAVGATDQKNARATFSNFGPQLAITAPGVNILSTTPTYDVAMTARGVPKNYAALQGTSMSAPVVAGIAALLWAKHPDWTAQQIRKTLQDTAKPLGEAREFGAGLVNAGSALAR